jgi:glucose/arabinose dehydrogenase
VRLLLVATTGEARAISGVPEVSTVGHGGLIDLAVDPGYAENGTIYFSYLVGREEASSIRVMKAKLDGRNEALSGQQVLFESTASRPVRSVVRHPGYLFLTIGDRWLNEPAQGLAAISAPSSASIPTAGSRRTIRSLALARGQRSELRPSQSAGSAFDATRGELWSAVVEGGDGQSRSARTYYGWR